MNVTQHRMTEKESNTLGGQRLLGIVLQFISSKGLGESVCVCVKESERERECV